MLHVKEPIASSEGPVLEFLKKIKCEGLAQEPPLSLKWK